MSFLYKGLGLETDPMKTGISGRRGVPVFLQ